MPRPIRVNRMAKIAGPMTPIAASCATAPATRRGDAVGLEGVGA